MVRDHVARHADAALPRARAKVAERVPPAELVRYLVIVEAVRARRRFGVPAYLLDARARLRAFPKPDEPESGKARAREGVELLVRYLVEPLDLAPVFFRELVEPYEGAFRHEDDVRHPVAVGAKPFIFLADVAELVRAHVGEARDPAAARPAGFFFLGDRVDSREKPREPLAEEFGPPRADVVELTLKVVG